MFKLKMFSLSFLVLIVLPALVAQGAGFFGNDSQ